MSIVESIVLGIVQGLTEFLPISSTAHLRIVPALFGWNDPGTAFSAVIQLGTMFAVIVYFYKDLKKIYLKKSRLGLWILISTIPICIFGILFKDQIEGGLVRNLNLIAFYLIFFGVLLFLSEMLSKQNKSLDNINFWDVFLIGIMQSFALIPGVSRSGVTLFAGLLIGYKRSDAARFSFLLSVPAVFASGLLEFITFIKTVNSVGGGFEFFNLFLGVVVSYFSGYLAIDFLLKYLQFHKTHIFVIYRVLLGVLILFLSFKGFIH